MAIRQIMVEGKGKDMALLTFSGEGENWPLLNGVGGKNAEMMGCSAWSTMAVVAARMAEEEGSCTV